MPFISISCLIALARASSTMLNKIGDSGILVLFLNLEESSQHFTIAWVVICGFDIYGLYYVDMQSLNTQFVDFLNHEWMLNFVKCSFCIYWDDHMLFILYFVNVVYVTFYWHEPSMYHWNKSNLILLIYCWIQFANTLWGFL